MKENQEQILQVSACFTKIMPANPLRKLVGNYDTGEEVNTLEFMELMWQDFPTLNYWLRSQTFSGDITQRVEIVTCGADPVLVIMILEALQK